MKHQPVVGQDVESGAISDQRFPMPKDPILDLRLVQSDIKKNPYQGFLRKTHDPTQCKILPNYALRGGFPNLQTFLFSTLSSSLTREKRFCPAPDPLPDCEALGRIRRGGEEVASTTLSGNRSRTIKLTHRVVQRTSRYPW
jgi:hypothetical protein